MSILIKGMDMPNDCRQCKLARYDDYENETFCPFTDVMCLSIGRQDDCPLEEVPETHDKRTETHSCDLIDRQAAIDACIRVREYRAYDEIEEIKALPSAQPDLIACGDCKHWINHDRRCGFWNHGVRIIDWCSRAERREDV